VNGANQVSPWNPFITQGPASAGVPAWSLALGASGRRGSGVIERAVAPATAQSRRHAQHTAST